MSSSQKFGLFILIVISIAYVYFSFFGKDFEFPYFDNTKDEKVVNPSENTESDIKLQEEQNKITKTIRIYILDKDGDLRGVNRTCETLKGESCFEYAITELVSAPTKWEKSRGFTSEIPIGTKVLSVREGSGSAMIDLSQEFQAGGGAESTYTRVKQLIKTAKANTKLPVYLYINGKQASVIGGEGLMIKQPLDERSLDE